MREKAEPFLGEDRKELASLYGRKDCDIIDSALRVRS